jgi:hypothetical protein
MSGEPARDDELDDRQLAAAQRFAELCAWLDIPPEVEATDEEAERYDRVRTRLSTLVASVVLERERLVARLGSSYVPEGGLGPDNAAENVEYDLCVRYERVAGLMEAYVGDELLITVPLATLDADPSAN